MPLGLRAGHIAERNVEGKRFLVNALRRRHSAVQVGEGRRERANSFDVWERFHGSHVHATMLAGRFPSERFENFREGRVGGDSTYAYVHQRPGAHLGCPWDSSARRHDDRRERRRLERRPHELRRLVVGSRRAPDLTGRQPGHRRPARGRAPGLLDQGPGHPGSGSSLRSFFDSEPPALTEHRGGSGLWLGSWTNCDRTDRCHAGPEPVLVAVAVGEEDWRRSFRAWTVGSPGGTWTPPACRLRNLLLIVPIPLTERGKDVSITPRRSLSSVLLALLSLLAAALFAAPTASARTEAVPTATLTEVTGFGTNPSNLQMYLYVPDNVTAHPRSSWPCTTAPAPDRPCTTAPSGPNWPTATASW